jgi:hypothetical protein
MNYRVAQPGGRWINDGDPMAMTLGKRCYGQACYKAQVHPLGDLFTLPADIFTHLRAHISTDTQTTAQDRRWRSTVNLIFFS